MSDRFKQLWTFIRPYRKQLYIAIGLTGALTVVGMMPPLIMRRLVNDVAREGRWDVFPLLITALCAIPLLRAGINLANGITLNVVGLGIIGETRRKLFKHLMHLTMRFYDEMPIGGVNQRLMGDVGAISNIVTGGAIGLVADLISVVFALVIMLQLSPLLSALTLCLLPLYFINYKFFSARLKRTNSVLRAHMDHISTFLQERLSAHELMQSYAQEDKQATHFNSQSKQVMDAALRNGTYNVSFNQIAAFINKMGNTLIYCVGCYFIIRGSMQYGDVVAFCAYAMSLLGPVVRFSSVANQFTQVGVSIDRINEIRNRKPALVEAPDARSVPSLKGDIEVDGVVFEYDSDSPALNEVSLEMSAGANVAILGMSGAGRTTLAMLLRRYYDPAEGVIRVDGVDIREYKIGEYRRSMAMISSQSAIFDGTIRENITYGQPDAAEDGMIEVSRRLGLHEFVMEFKNGYDTRLGTGGLRLSTGMQQKIGVARALLTDPDVLIADEATGSLDAESAHMVNDVIWEFMEDKTCVMIVNRALMAKRADEVVVLGQGEVVEHGNEEELWDQKDSVYRQIYTQQYGGTESNQRGVK